jgi:type V secretory pathway adhesin AidA
MIKGYKGFDKNLQCRGFQYKVGKTFEEKGTIKACESGFHFCENPFNVFNYYSPSDSRYCNVEGDGKIDTDNSDSKVACSKLHIHTEIGLSGLISAGVKFILDKVDWGNNKATNTGYQSAATNTGYRSAATNTGYRSAATNTGYQSAATNTGDRSAASVEGKDSIAIVTGYDSKAKGAMDCWIVLTERGDWDGNTYPIINVQAFKVDGISIKADTFYKLKNSKPVEAK